MADIILRCRRCGLALEQHLLEPTDCPGDFPEVQVALAAPSPAVPPQYVPLTPTAPPGALEPAVSDPIRVPVKLPPLVLALLAVLAPAFVVVGALPVVVPPFGFILSMLGFGLGLALGVATGMPKWLEGHPLLPPAFIAPALALGGYLAQLAVTLPEGKAKVFVTLAALLCFGLAGKAAPTFTQPAVPATPPTLQ